MTEQHLLLASDAPEPAERNSAHPALERMSLSAGSPQEQARAVNQKAKRSNLLMTNRHFTLGKEIGVFGSHEFHVDVQCISNDKSSETVVIKQGTYVSLLQRAEPVRVFVAFTATNGTQARLLVRGDNEAGDPYPVSVLDVAEIVTDTPPGPQFWPAVNKFIDSRRKCELEKQEQRKEARGAKKPPSTPSLSCHSCRHAGCEEGGHRKGPSLPPG